MKIELLNDPVLAAADIEFARRGNSRRRRMHLGMSSGGRCPRAQWYGWLWASGDETIDAVGLKRIADGYAGEDLAAARIQAAADVILLTRDPETGEQFAVEDADGHVAGHMDGVVTHHATAPKTPHVWESKVTNEKNLARFRKIKSEVGEKSALREWSFEYWVQAQLYMHHGGYKRHWTVISSPGCRDWDSCRTEIDRDQAEYYASRLARFVENVDELPERVSDKASAFVCRWCSHSAVCHDGAAVEVNCRTCRFSAPTAGPNWHCSQWDKDLTADEQVAGCERHEFRTALKGELDE